MQESNLASIGDAAIEYQLTGRQRPREGNRHPDVAPHGIFPSSGDDRWIAIACESEEQWNALDGVAGLGWAADERFADNAARKRNEDDLEAAIAAWTADQDRHELSDELITAGVIAAPVLEPDEVAQDADLQARGTIVPIDHPEAGHWPQAGNPVRFSRTPAEDLVARNITGKGAPQ